MLLKQLKEKKSKVKKYSAIATMDSFKNRTDFEKTNPFFVAQ